MAPIYQKFLLAVALCLDYATATTSNHSYSEPQTITRFFHAAGRTPGTVTFTIMPDYDPSTYGIPLLGFPDWNNTLGFPTAHGTVSSPYSPGYASLYGWVQIIASSNSTTPADSTNWAIDLVPVLSTLDNPFVWYGSEASLFDGPFNLEVQEVDWSARSFLAYLPNPALKKEIVPLAGFEWGYKLIDGNPIVKELQELNLTVWNEHLGLFRSNFTSWNFTQVGMY